MSFLFIWIYLSYHKVHDKIQDYTIGVLPKDVFWFRRIYLEKKGNVLTACLLNERLENKIKHFPKIYWLNDGVLFSICETRYHATFLPLSTIDL